MPDTQQEPEAEGDDAKHPDEGLSKGKPLQPDQQHVKPEVSTPGIRLHPSAFKWQSNRLLRHVSLMRRTCASPEHRKGVHRLMLIRGEAEVGASGGKLFEDWLTICVWLG